jgi:hypothetical protein
VKTTPAFRASIVLAALCCALAGVHAAEQTKKEVRAMTSKQDEVARMLDLPANDYFSFDEGAQIRLQDALMQLATGGAVPSRNALPDPLLVLGAPKSVHLERQSTVPVLVASVASGLRGWQVNYRPNLHLLLRNLTTGELSAVQPLLSMRRGSPQLASGKGTPPNDVNAATVYSSVERIDLRERLAQVLAPGSFALTAVVNDLASNSVAIRIEGGAPAPASAPRAPEAYVRNRLEPRPMPDTVVQVPKSASAGDPILVRVALQVSEDAGVLQASPSPLWPSHVILVKLDERPQVIPATVPVQRVGTAPRGPYNAVFQVDLRAASRAPLGGTYQVYIDAGNRLLGPYPLAAAE